MVPRATSARLPILWLSGHNLSTGGRLIAKIKGKLLRRLLKDPRVYDIVAAIRGPDFSCEPLKSVLTINIRGLVTGNQKRATIHEYNILHAISYCYHISRNETERPREYFACIHFIMHARDAVMGMLALRLIDPLDADMLVRVCDLLMSALGKDLEGALRELWELYEIHGDRVIPWDRVTRWL